MKMIKNELLKNEVLKNEVLKNGVERKYIKLYFGSRCEEDFDDVVLNDKIFDVWYNDFKNECIDEGYEYIIDLEDMKEMMIEILL